MSHRIVNVYNVVYSMYILFVLVVCYFWLPILANSVKEIFSWLTNGYNNNTSNNNNVVFNILNTQFFLELSIEEVKITHSSMSGGLPLLFFVVLPQFEGSC